MLALRKAEDRGHTELGWLDSRHTFSFGGYHDGNQMGFGPLRVINDDRVAAGGGFPTHAHADMEIITYVLDGALEHKDSLGTGSVIRPGDVQRMTAGTGIRHSEFNASATEPVHFLQIWVIPERRGLTPGYEQANFDAAARRGTLRLIGSRDGRDGSVTIHQDVALYAAALPGNESVAHTLAPGRAAWVHVAKGGARINGTPVAAGDGVAVTNPGQVELKGSGDGADLLLFDIAA